MGYNVSHTKKLIGKSIIIGLTFLNYEGAIVERKQLFGVIRSIGEDGIYIKLQNSEEEYTLPPDLSAIEKAPQGEYRLKSTGEVIVNPDLKASWTIQEPNPNDSNNMTDEK